jgi:Chaperone of endosialidase
MGTNKSGTSTVSPSPQGITALNAVLPQIQTYTNPATYNPGQPLLQTAPINEEQYAGINTLNQASEYNQEGIDAYGVAYNTFSNEQPYINEAGQPINEQQIANYYNPYEQAVIGTTEQQFNLQNATQQNQLVGNAAAQNALGGNRIGVAGSQLAYQQATAEDPILAGLEQQGYAQAVATAEQQYQQIPLAAASALQAMGSGYAGVGAGITGAATNLAGIGAQEIGAGTVEQQTQQQADLAKYQQQEAYLGYPLQLTQLAAGDIGSLAQAYGSTTTTTPPAPNIFTEAAGLGTFGLGAASLYNASDKRIKEDIHKIGKLKDGQTVYRFRYKGHPQWHIGLMAQDVEKKRPDAVREFDGIKAIDIKKATDAAARRFGGRIQGLQTGGIPYSGSGGGYAGLGSMPYAAGIGYVPQGSAPHIPAPQASSVQIPQDNPTQMFTQALQMAKLGSGSGGSGPLSGPINNLKTNIANTFDPFSDADLEEAGAGLGQARGGRIGKAYGGLALPRNNRISVPTRAGFGLASFMPHRDSGGGVAEDVPAIAPLMNNLAFSEYGLPSAYGLGTQTPSNAYSDSYSTGMDDGGVPPDVPDEPIAPSDHQIVSGASPPLASGLQAGPVAVPASGAGLASPPPAPSAESVPDVITKGPEAVQQQANPLDRLMRGIAQNETGGERNPYGSVTSTGTGHKVYGKYQIYDENIPTWTQQATGRALTPAQFLASREAQEATARYKLGEYASKYGYAGAARAWLAGEGGMNNPNARDRFGSDPYGYATKALAHAGFDGDEGGVHALAYDTPSNPQSGIGTPGAGAAPIPSRPAASPSETKKGLWGDPDFGMALMAAGLGMIGNRSPYAGVGIGQGALQGLGYYAGQKRHEEDVAMKTKQLDQAADLAQDRIEAETERHRETLAQQKSQQEQAKELHEVPAGYRRTDKGLEAIPGGPSDIPVVSAQAKAKMQAGMMSQDAIEQAARRDILGDSSGMTGLNRGASGTANLNAARDREAKILQEEMDMTPQQAAEYVARKRNEFRAAGIGMSAEARTAGTREANLNMILATTDAAIPSALETSKKVARTGWVPINKIIQYGEVIASDPDLKEFGMANLQLAEAWARAMNATGVMRESDRDKALEYLSTADSPATYERAVNRLRTQIMRERNAVRSQKPVQPGGAAPSEQTTTSAAPAAAAEPVPKVGDVKKGHKFKGGDPSDKNNWEKQ